MRELDTCRSTLMAQNFLTRSFAPDDSIALLLRRDTPATATQRIVLLREVLTPRYLGWLARENIAGTNIYVAAIRCAGRTPETGSSQGNSGR
jgi:hypothetical protein